MGFNNRGKRIKRKKYRIIDIAQYLGISEKSVYNIIKLL